MRTALLVILTTLLMPASCLDATARADDVLVYPGMEIVQGNTTCTLGYVDPKTRVGMAAGQCSVNSDGPVYDTNGNRVGEMVIAHSNWTDGSTVTGNVYMVDYEGILFDRSVPINDVLPNGIRLSLDKIAPTKGLPVCRNGIGSGEACGQITWVNNGWFRVDGPPCDRGDSGAAVYSITSAGQGSVVGIVAARYTDNRSGEVQTLAISWNTIVTQLRKDTQRGA
ncbi:Rv1815 family serine proteinase [Mycobacteroides saopaulense]|uniref:Serine protease n=1 Tax=Mycobacteroides saopaulense TaxID=1578165 RepID=A0ABX3C5Z6_9MYCO|nr:hypothetical protein [Mycobacteroides saopaulense]OHT89172.1 hypothetical protein BKG68_04885 [Mycobacteroides saopaulense]OHU13993.1 hypothetical protein BKG73_04895 [Mycobacteroides saopaulense]